MISNYFYIFELKKNYLFCVFQKDNNLDKNWYKRKICTKFLSVKMKFLIFVVVGISSVFSQNVTWEEYKKMFGKIYTDSLEDSVRKVYFTNQISFMNMLNKEATFKVDLNSLSDCGFGYNFNYCFRNVEWSTDFPKGSPIEMDNTENLPESFELDTSGVEITDQSKFNKVL